MGMVAPSRRIGSTFFVAFGQHGQVTQFAHEQGVSRQFIYREARQVIDILDGRHTRQQFAALYDEIASLRQRFADAQDQLGQSVLIDGEKQAEFACVGQACGVTLAQVQTLLSTLIADPLSVASLGRATHAMGQKAGKLLEILDEFTRPLVQDVSADEIYVKDPTLMIVEQSSLCWVCGRLSEDATGKTWATQFGQLPNLEQVARDGGKGLAKGVMLVNAQREQNEMAKQEPIVDQGDHFHAFRPGGVSLSRFARRAQKALTEAEEAQTDLEKLARQGKSLTGATSRARHAWLRAEQAMDEWMQVEKDWTAAKKALELITPKGELNTRAKAEAKLAEILPRLPEPDFAKAKRQLEQPTMLSYLDRVESELAKLEMPAEVKQAAIEQESLRRRPELLEGESAKAAAMRGVMLTCGVILSAAGNAGVEAVASVREIFGRAYRASSLVECINSVLRMHQAQHRKMSQEMLDLKRLYWNGHEFRTGRRKGKTPYELLGVPWPKEQCWWHLLKISPEQLRDKLSTMKNTA